MSRKGLSFEEKKARMLQLLYEKREFFQLKELEKCAPKERGITLNSVKDVVKALVDDGTVDTDKVGGSVYFWAFPSKLINNKKRKLEEIQDRLESSVKKIKLVNDNLKAQEDKENTTVVNSSEIRLEINRLEQRKSQLAGELKSLQEVDPEKVENMMSQIEPIKTAANRWTDNVFAVKSWCNKKFMIEAKVLNKQFNIPEDLDYVA